MGEYDEPLNPMDLDVDGLTLDSEPVARPEFRIAEEGGHVVELVAA